MARALDGLRVIDLSRVLAGPYCTQMLADHGAKVTKVESPAGDETRAWGPPFVAPDVSAYYWSVNRAKDNIVLDFSSAEGREILRRLFASADVVVENFKTGTLARWGLSDDDLRECFPRLVHCRIAGFGDDGPLGGLPGYDAVLQAYGGLMDVNGEADGPPLRVGVPIVDLATGILAFSGILLALRERDLSGLGQLVDVTLLDTAISLLHPHSGAWLADGTPARRTGSAHPTIAPYDNFRTASGLLFIGVGNDRQFATLTDILGVPELADDPRYATSSDRIRNVATLRDILRSRISARHRDELAERLLAGGVPASPVNGVSEALTAPQVLHREMVVEREDGYRGIGIPIKLSRTPGQVGDRPRGAGQDTQAVLAAAGYSAAEIEAILAGGAAR